MNSRQEADLLRALDGAGYEIASLWEWVNAPTPPGALPILIQYLHATDDEPLVEAIVRALTEKAARPAIPALLAKFTQIGSDHVRWAIANAIATIGVPRAAWPIVLHLAADPTYGSGRQPLVAILHRVKLPQTLPVLHGLLVEPEVAAFAANALGFCGSAASLALLEQIDTPSGSPLLQREVPKAVARLRKKHCGHA